MKENTKTTADIGAAEKAATSFADHQALQQAPLSPMKENETVAGSNLEGPKVTITRVSINKRPTSEG